MAETRLRYRRIAPKARSGSLGSLGNHFPARFQFPHRRSLLESLTSDDDEPNSFAIRRRKDKSKKKRKRMRKKKRQSQLPHSNTTSGVAPIAIAPPDDHASDDDSTPVSTSPTTPLPMSPACNAGTLVVREHYQHAMPAQDAWSRESCVVASQSLPPRSAQMHTAPEVNDAQLDHAYAAKDMDSDEHVPRPDGARRARSEHVVRGAGRPHSLSDVSELRSLGNKNMDKDNERDAGNELVAEACVLQSVDGRRISAPAAMSAEMKAQFVLRVERPVIYVRTKREEVGKRGQKGKRRVTKKKTEEEEGVGVMRDREVSVSFAHRRMTAEEAAWKPWDALQKLLHAIVFVRVMGLKGGKSR